MATVIRIQNRYTRLRSVVSMLIDAAVVLTGR